MRKGREENTPAAVTPVATTTAAVAVSTGESDMALVLSQTVEFFLKRAALRYCVALVFATYFWTTTSFPVCLPRAVGFEAGYKKKLASLQTTTFPLAP